jgi:hypothetical protein
MPGILSMRCILIAAALLLSACTSAPLPTQLVVEAIRTDASAVQAAAPESRGKRDPGQPTGLLAYYADDNPTELIVFCHGLGHNVEDSWRQHVLSTIRPGRVVVTTNYRDNLKFPILRGAHDTIAATLMAKARFPGIRRVYLLGVSMGGAISGTAISESVHVTPDGSGLYDYWVNVEGLSNQFEAWAEASAALPEVAANLEEDAGGRPDQVPEAYVRRSPALRTADMVNDGLVVYNQAREMAAALVGAGIPTRFYNVLRHREGQSAGTTGTGFFGALLGTEDPNRLNLAGHGSEADAKHPVIRTGFEELERMLDGDYDDALPYDEGYVDEPF